MKIAVWYHTLLTRGTSPDPWPLALSITQEAMESLEVSGLLDACDELNVGVNGLESEAVDFAQLVIPKKAKIIWHGRYFNENGTICALHAWAKTHPNWAILYFHCKGGASHEPDSGYYKTVSEPWRQTMTKYLVGGWRQCVQHLEGGFEAVGCHLMRGMADGTQNIWPGNCWWVTSDFVASVPDMRLRERIKISGIESAESRYEAEVWLMNARIPLAFDLLPQGGGGIP